VEILGAIVENVNGKPALKFLADIPKTVKQKLNDTSKRSYSANENSMASIKSRFYICIAPTVT
jgi:hypothetical protein